MELAIAGAARAASSAAGASWRGVRRDGQDQRRRWQSRRLAGSSTGVRLRRRARQKQAERSDGAAQASGAGWVDARAASRVRLGEAGEIGTTGVGAAAAAAVSEPERWLSPQLKTLVRVRVVGLCPM